MVERGVPATELDAFLRPPLWVAKRLEAEDPADAVKTERPSWPPHQERTDAPDHPP